MVEYVSWHTSEWSLRVNPCGSAVEFTIAHIKDGGHPMEIRRDAVAALVGQLQSWLERNKGE